MTCWQIDSIMNTFLLCGSLQKRPRPSFRYDVWQDRLPTQNTMHATSLCTLAHTRLPLPIQCEMKLGSQKGKLLELGDTTQTIKITIPGQIKCNLKYGPTIGIQSSGTGKKVTAIKQQLVS